MMKYMMRRAAALLLAVTMVSCLAACGKGGNDKTAENLLNSVTARDVSLYTAFSADAEISINGDMPVEYKSSASWEDMGGVRHLMPGESYIGHDGLGEQAFTEAWSDASGVYIYTDASGWQARGAGSGADDPVALDFNAITAYIAALPKGHDSVSASKTDIGTELSWQDSFKSVSRMAGGYADSLDAEKADVKAVFGTMNQLEQILVTASGGNGSFRLDIKIGSWNGQDHETLAVPDDVKGAPDGAADGLAEPDPADAAMQSYEGKVEVSDGFLNDGLSVFADSVQSAGIKFDDVQSEKLEKFDRVLYHNHGPMKNGWWFGVVAVEDHSSQDAIDARAEDYKAYNDAWYGSNGGGSDAGVWSVLDPGSQVYKLELVFQYDAYLCDVQIEAYLADGVQVSDLQAEADQMLADMGIVVQHN